MTLDQGSAMRIISALVLGAALAALPVAAQTGPVTVDDSHLRSLQGRLDGFSSGLSAEERVLWNRMLLRAAQAPAGGADVRVLPVLQIGPGGGCEPGPDDGPSRVGIIVQGGRTAMGGVAAGGSSCIIVQGGRGAAGGGAAPAGRARVGGRPGAPAARVVRPTEAVSIGPKQEDPARPAPESLARRITQLSGQLPAEERGALEWLLTRAAAVPEGRPATPGGLPEGVSLRQALGVEPLAIGPKLEDPTRGPPTPPATRWIVRH
jgi:hypothetical protein